MLITPTIAAVDGEAIVWVVIIFGGVIGQIFKAIRKASKNKTPPPTVKPVAPPSAPESTYRAPKQEIRQFLESLGKKMDVTPAPPPRAVPVPVATPVPRTPPPPRRPAPTPPAPRPKRTPVAAVPYVPIQTTGSAVESERRKSKAREAILGGLRSTSDLRTAMVLRDILGPPVALRKPTRAQ